MLNWLDPSLSAASLAVHVTVVVPTGYLPPDTTTLPAWFSHLMLAAGMTPSKASNADGDDDQVTAALGIPGFTFWKRTLFGVVITGGSISVST